MVKYSLSWLGLFCCVVALTPTIRGQLFPRVPVLPSSHCLQCLQHISLMESLSGAGPSSFLKSYIDHWASHGPLRGRIESAVLGGAFLKLQIIDKIFRIIQAINKRSEGLNSDSIKHIEHFNEEASRLIIDNLKETQGHLQGNFIDLLKKYRINSADLSWSQFPKIPLRLNSSAGEGSSLWGLDNSTWSWNGSNDGQRRWTSNSEGNGSNDGQRWWTSNSGGNGSNDGQRWWRSNSGGNGSMGVGSGVRWSNNGSKGSNDERWLWSNDGFWWSNEENVGSASHWNQSSLSNGTAPTWWGFLNSSESSSSSAPTWWGFLNSSESSSSSSSSSDSSSSSSSSSDSSSSSSSDSLSSSSSSSDSLSSSSSSSDSSSSSSSSSDSSSSSSSSSESDSSSSSSSSSPPSSSSSPSSSSEFKSLDS